MSTTTIRSDADKITPKFNIALFLFTALVGIIKFAVLSKVSFGVFLRTSFIDIIFNIAALLIFAWFLKEFWQRLLSDLFPIRNINYQEAIAIVLVLSIVLRTYSFYN